MNLSLCTLGRWNACSLDGHRDTRRIPSVKCVFLHRQIDVRKRRTLPWNTMNGHAYHRRFPFSIKQLVCLRWLNIMRLIRKIKTCLNNPLLIGTLILTCRLSNFATSEPPIDVCFAAPYQVGMFLNTSIYITILFRFFCILTTLIFYVIKV